MSEQQKPQSAETSQEVTSAVMNLTVLTQLHSSELQRRTGNNVIGTFCPLAPRRPASPGSPADPGPPCRTMEQSQSWNWPRTCRCQTFRVSTSFQKEVKEAECDEIVSDWNWNPCSDVGHNKAAAMPSEKQPVWKQKKHFNFWLEEKTCLLQQASLAVTFPSLLPRFLELPYPAPAGLATD